jgi:hypothetical protein
MQVAFSKSDKARRGPVGSRLMVQLLFRNTIGLEHMATHQTLTIDMKTN